MRLPKSVQSKLDKVEGGSFKPLPAGVYEAKVEEISLAKGNAGPYWKWVFEITEDGYEGKKQFLNTSHSDESLWKLKQTLEAFGADIDVDSDDLIGQPCRLVVSETVVGAGARKGQPTNNVDEVLAADESEVTDEDGPADDEDEDLKAIGQAADLDDDDAIGRLEELAEQAGLVADDFDTWEELAVALNGAKPKAKSKAKVSAETDDFDL